MTRIQFIITCLLAGALSVMASGCTEECTDNQNALPLAGYYSSPKPTQTVSVDSLEIYGVGAPGDSILVDGSGSRSSVYLPFRIDSDTTVYVFRPITAAAKAADIRDTVRFIYSREPHFVNTACGVSYIFRMRAIECSGEVIDSVTCPGGEITNANRENLHIYFHATESETDPEQ